MSTSNSQEICYSTALPGIMDPSEADGGSSKNSANKEYTDPNGDLNIFIAGPYDSKTTNFDKLRFKIFISKEDARNKCVVLGKDSTVAAADDTSVDPKEVIVYYETDIHNADYENLYLKIHHTQLMLARGTYVVRIFQRQLTDEELEDETYHTNSTDGYTQIKVFTLTVKSNPIQGPCVKEINPVITQPSVSFSMSGASNNSLQEIGAQLNLTFTANFNQGNVRNNWGSKDLQSSTYSGVPNTYTFTGTGLTPSVSSTSLSNQQTVNPYKVVAGSQTWTASVTYDAGTYQPKTNRENAYSSPCPAGTKTGGTLKLIGVYPTFATSTALGTATKQALKEEPANGSAYITFTLAGESSPDQRQFFELPKSWSALTGVADSGGAWYNGGKSGSLLQWTMSEVNETVQGEQVPYRRYTYNGPLSAIRTIRVFTK